MVLNLKNPIPLIFSFNKVNQQNEIKRIMPFSYRTGGRWNEIRPGK